MDGVEITGMGSDNNTISQNGIEAIDSTRIGRHGVFIRDGATGNIIDSNTMAWIDMNGIYILGAHQTMISNNIINLYRSGRNGIAIEGGSTATTIMNNDIASSGWHGVWISDHGTMAAVTGNSILNSMLHGVAIYNGAQSTVSGNFIGNSGWSGIAIVNSNGNAVANNAIGTYRTLPDSISFGNGYYGVAVVEGSNNIIGPGNLIAHNGLTTASDGIRIDGSTALHNRITQNSIFDNGGKGIALVNGGNASVLAPALYQANCQAIIGGANVNSVIEILSDASNEGRYFEGATLPTSMTPFGWSGAFRGPNVTATATDSTDNTSEFSAPIASACFKLHLPLLRK